MITIIPFFLGVFSSKVHNSKLLEPQILVRIVTRSFDLSSNEDKIRIHGRRTVDQCGLGKFRMCVDAEWNTFWREYFWNSGPFADVPSDLFILSHISYVHIIRRLISLNSQTPAPLKFQILASTILQPITSDGTWHKLKLKNAYGPRGMRCWRIIRGRILWLCHLFILFYSCILQPYRSTSRIPSMSSV